MWSSSYSKTVKGLTAQQVWDVWTDVNQWHTWQDDIDYARLEGEFESGNSFKFRPKGGPDINIELAKVERDSVFVDITRFPLAKMVDSHELIQRGDALEIKTTLTVQGPLSFVWRKLVVENIASGLPLQTDKLIAKAANGRSITVQA
ncbi:MAG: SRPBCC family protein [Burkholderiales bacterium]|nr:SRPBCC family protein [Burkholderiales bacterium]